MLTSFHDSTTLGYVLGISAEDYALAPQSHGRLLGGHGPGWNVVEILQGSKEVTIFVRLAWGAERTKATFEQWLFLRVDEARAEASKAKLINSRYEALGKKIGLI